jgi:hypothetical protein
MLNPTQHTEFAKRDLPSLDAAFSELPRYWEQAFWLSSRNSYRVNCIERLTADFRPGSHVTHKHLREYIAASTIVHGFDGWSYLGRAVSALLIGDHDCARHLGYYAELRAAMAILAADGIGVFDKEHVVVSASGKCLQMPPLRGGGANARPGGPGTHAFVWNALEELMRSTTSANLLLSITSAGGLSLSEWLSHFASAPAVTSKLSEDWLRAWGLDIARLAGDRDARNLSSYRPTSFTTPRPPDAKTVVDFVLRLWSLCEPTIQNPFAVLDRFLLRATLQNGFRAAYGKSAKSAKKQFRSVVESLLTSLRPHDVTGMDWVTFLGDVPSDPLDVLAQASGTVGPDNKWHSIQVISRAFLLLRVAAGTGQRLLQKLPTGDAVHLDFWMSEIGIDRALWASGNQPASLSDLWADTSDAIDELRLSLATIESSNVLWRKFPFAAGILSSCERVGLWGLGL